MGLVQLVSGILVGWLVANLVDGMRPVAWAKLADELAADLTQEIKVILEPHEGRVGSGPDWANG